jgi:nucleotide-binding universal stress UspA family protein
MYHKILVALDATAADETILSHVIPLAQTFDSAIVLLHVADGWAARLFGRDAVSVEVKRDQDYLESIRGRLVIKGLRAEVELAFGEPADEIVRWVGTHGCDLIAMATHGHRLISDMLYGTTADKVRHRVDVPVLLLKARK